MGNALDKVKQQNLDPHGPYDTYTEDHGHVFRQHRQMLDYMVCDLCGYESKQAMAGVWVCGIEDKDGNWMEVYDGFYRSPEPPCPERDKVRIPICVDICRRCRNRGTEKAQNGSLLNRCAIYFGFYDDIVEFVPEGCEFFMEYLLKSQEGE